MGVLFSCPADDYDPLDVQEEAPAPATSSAAGAGEPAPAILRASLSSGKLRIEGSLSFKRAQAALLQVETEISIRTADAAAPGPLSLPCRDREREVTTRARFAEPAAASDSPKHEAAALRLQKVYKSFRTRRQLADCAVLVEQSWWKLLDFALLKRSSVSFFDIEKQETAMSKWSRARTRVAKVGKGLLKDDNAQKLALQHWLEAVSVHLGCFYMSANLNSLVLVSTRSFCSQVLTFETEIWLFYDEQIDPRHRYGHNLHYYYDCWLHSESKQPFFYWLVGLTVSNSDFIVSAAGCNDSLS